MCQMTVGAYLRNIPSLRDRAVEPALTVFLPCNGAGCDQMLHNAGVLSHKTGQESSTKNMIKQTVRSLWRHAP